MKAQTANWLLSTLTWWPLLAWVGWTLLDGDLATHPLAAYVSVLTLAINWIYMFWYGRPIPLNPDPITVRQEIVARRNLHDIPEQRLGCRDESKRKELA